MALLALDVVDQARTIFERLVQYGQNHLNDEIRMDYFAVSLPDFVVFDADLNQRNRIHCLYMMALGELGLGDDAAAQLAFDRVLAAQPDHFGAAIHRAWMADRHRYPLLVLAESQGQ
jgi:hypothetical protein